MTPFGARMRELRAARGLSLSRMAADLNISAAYLSALERGHRGRPTPGLVQQICGYFGLIWDDVEHVKHLAARSHPRITLNTAGLSPEVTWLANDLAAMIRDLPDDGARDLRNRLAVLCGKEPE
ncbi:MAG: helix-turn-helix transcriptional regulator [Rhodospirillaceae bacterium]|nr:helix-turn-helix transcriptional regulator [Rhodospirillaceae bacterium]